MNKKMIALVILVLCICVGCSNKSMKNSDYIFKEQLTDNDELELLKHKVDVGFDKFIIKGSLLKKLGAKEYTIHVDQYENNKKVTNIEFRNIDIKDKYNLDFINYYDLSSDNCYDKTCYVDFLIKMGGSSISKLSSTDLKNFNYSTKYPTTVYSENEELNNKEDININSKVIIKVEMYDPDMKNDSSFDNDYNIESIKKNAKAVTVVYVTFSNKQ